jgi:hypothetical protein
MNDADLFARGVAVSTDVLVQELPGEETVLLNTATEEYFGLDAVGTHMWTVLLDAGSVDDACTRLLHHYDVDEGGLRDDVRAFVGKLLERGLITLDG